MKGITLICGARGQFGKLIANQFEKGQVPWAALSYDKANAIRENVLYWDFHDVDVLRRMLNQIKIDSIIYCSAWHRPNMLASSGAQDDEMFDWINFSCFRHIVENSMKDDPLHVVYFGSSQMYAARGVDDKISSDRAFSPINAYARSKVKAFDWLCDQRSDISSTRIICCNHLSQLRKPPFLVPDLALKILETPRSVKVRNASSRIDIGSAEELAQAVFSLSQIHADSQFVAGRGESYSVREVFRMLADHLGKNPHLISTNDRLEPNMVADREDEYWINTGFVGISELLGEVASNYVD